MRLSWHLIVVIISMVLVCGTMPASIYADSLLSDRFVWEPMPTVEQPGMDSIDAVEEVSFIVAEPSSDSVPIDTNRNWWHLFKKKQLRMDDPSVEWPGFLGFCVKVYNWGDRVFSSTDTAYVVGTGKKWRTRLINDNWADSYYMKVGEDFTVLMNTPFHVLAGASLQYLAVGYTYAVDMTHLLTKSPIDYRKQEFSFNCARFSADAYFYSNSATYIRSFGEYPGRLREEFKGLDMKIFGLDAYYFFNGYKYSQAAAYSFSKIQKKSQGCVIGGLSYCNQNLALDFAHLPEKLLPYLELTDLFYRVHYNDFNVLIGFGYNWVISPHWLYNVTVLPGIGFNHCYEDSEEGSAKLFSMSARGMTSLTYNNGNWFAGLQGKVRGNWYHSNRINLFNAVEGIVLSAGFRFW